MDSRGESLQPPLHHHHHHQAPPPDSQSLMMAPPPLQQHQQKQQPPPNIYNNHNNHNNNSINPNSISASMMQQQQHSHHQHQQQHQHQHQQTQNPSRFPFNSENAQYTAEGSSPSSGGLRPGGGFSIEPARKKRGRPRKYSPSPDGNSIALGLAPAPITPISTEGSGHLDSSNDGGGGGSSSNHNNNNNNSQMSSGPSSGKKARGRPAGSGKKQLDALGSAGIGFTPHVIMVKTGEDIATKIMAFSQQGPRTVCILSANGAICNVTLRQPAMSGGTVTYEGRFEIISLSGSFLLSESNGNHSRNGGLSVSLAGPDGRVFGGGVAGMLVAATPIQVVVGSFIADGKKPKSGSSSAPPPNMLNFGAPVPGISPPSEGASSETSDESGSSPVNRLSAPSYNNSTQPIQNIPMYTTNLGWPNSTMNMLPN